MRKFVLFFSAILITTNTVGQIIVIGHNKFNNEPVKKTRIVVKENGVVTRTISTNNSSDFIIKFEFGKRYEVFFQNSMSPLTHLDIIADNVPEDKFSYKMVHETYIPFYHKNDNDIDTTVFKDAFYRIIFDGSTRMISDTVYYNNFSRKVLKPQPSADHAIKASSPNTGSTVILAGHIILNNDKRLTVNNKTIVLYDKKDQIVASTSTNRYGAFYFSNVKSNEISKLKMELKEVKDMSSVFNLVNSRNYLIGSARPDNGSCSWELKNELLDSITDNNYLLNIGGKLVYVSSKSKRVFANQTVYLCNKFNTILQSTKTSVLGTFVFEGLKPDRSYFIGVDQKELRPGDKIDLLNKDDKYVAFFDTSSGGRVLRKINTSFNHNFNDISIAHGETMMTVNASLYGDNLDNPIGRLKVILLNDNYQVIDSAMTDDFGAFKFVYLPFLKKFYLSAENKNNVLDMYNNILIYNKDSKFIKIMTHEKGKKFTYKPLAAENFKLRDSELEDPWLDFNGDANMNSSKKIIIENILFENNSSEIKPQTKELLKKIVLVMQTNKKMKIEIGAHTDSHGTAESNLKLSESRAKAVLRYMISAGIDKSRMVSKGYGESKLLNNCDDSHPCDEIQHSHNRRIEFTIME
jgi:outer membrane protein OmpA-like peptidoglycan-associated protein